MSSEPPIRSPKRAASSCRSCAVLAIGAIGLAASGVLDRAKSSQEVARLDQQAGGPDRAARAGPNAARREQDLILPGNVERLLHRLAVCARQRLCDRLEQGHRRPCD